MVLKLMFREFDVFSTDVSYRSRFKMQNSKNFSPNCQKGLKRIENQFRRK